MKHIFSLLQILHVWHERHEDIYKTAEKLLRELVSIQ